MTPSKPPPRPNKLIDAVDAYERRIFHGRIWRAVREGYDVLRGSRSGGRWDDGTFDALYTSTEKDGAIAERHFHLSKGQPVFPSIPKYYVHEIETSLTQVLDLTDIRLLNQLGVDTSRFGALSYLNRRNEYPSTQHIGEIAYFLEFQGILVPNARWACNNLVLFPDRIRPADTYVVGSPELINWSTWPTK